MVLMSLIKTSYSLDLFGADIICFFVDSIKEFCGKKETNLSYRARDLCALEGSGHTSLRNCLDSVFNPVSGVQSGQRRPLRVGADKVPRLVSMCFRTCCVVVHVAFVDCL